jgi:hypothetical protein
VEAGAGAGAGDGTGAGRAVLRGLDVARVPDAGAGRAPELPEPGADGGAGTGDTVPGTPLAESPATGPDIVGSAAGTGAAGRPAGAAPVTGPQPAVAARTVASPAAIPVAVARRRPGRATRSLNTSRDRSEIELREPGELPYTQ